MLQSGLQHCLLGGNDIICCVARSHVIKKNVL
jgi:hypothetical protein